MLVLGKGIPDGILDRGSVMQYLLSARRPTAN